MQDPGSDILTRSESLIVIVPWDPGMQASWPAGSANQRVFHELPPQKLDPQTCVEGPLGEILTLWCAAEGEGKTGYHWLERGREGVQRWFPWKKGKKEKVE